MLLPTECCKLYKCLSCNRTWAESFMQFTEGQRVHAGVL